MYISKHLVNWPDTCVLLKFGSAINTIFLFSSEDIIELQVIKGDFAF